jgi:hypothetical protein
MKIKTNVKAGDPSDGTINVRNKPGIAQDTALRGQKCQDRRQGGGGGD